MKAWGSSSKHWRRRSYNGRRSEMGGNFSNLLEKPEGRQYTQNHGPVVLQSARHQDTRPTFHDGTPTTARPAEALRVSHPVLFRQFLTDSIISLKHHCVLPIVLHCIHSNPLTPSRQSTSDPSLAETAAYPSIHPSLSRVPFSFFSVARPHSIQSLLACLSVNA